MYKSASCLPEDENKLRLVVWTIAAFIFLACSLLLLSGWCLEKYNYYNHKRSELQYISTQMGACMHKHAYVTYGFVFAMGVHMLLLFDLLLHCMQVIPVQASTHILRVCNVVCGNIKREQLAYCIGILIIYFVIYLTSVAEFHSDGQKTEQVFHYLAAFMTIFLFWVIHFLICLYLLIFTLAPDHTYVSFRNLYFVFTVLFFCLWLLQIFFIVFLETAKIVEWILLLNGLLLQLYAEFSLYKHMQIKVYAYVWDFQERIVRQIEWQQQWNTHLNTSFVCASVIFSFVFTFVGFLFAAPPWFVLGTRIHKDLYTGPEFWIFVSATYVIVAWRLCSASFIKEML